MPQPRLNDLKSIRDALDMSQGKFAELMNISIRAVQSYEQGWRTVPAHVQCKAAMMVYLGWRKDQVKVEPCWDICGCEEEKKATCNAFLMNAGDLCWLMTDSCCQGKKLKTWQAKINRCGKCPAMTRWLRP